MDKNGKHGRRKWPGENGAALRILRTMRAGIGIYRVKLNGSDYSWVMDWSPFGRG